MLYFAKIPANHKEYDCFKTPNIKIPVSILAVEATAGFIISTNGLTRNSDISERDIAIPLKKPATQYLM